MKKKKSGNSFIFDNYKPTDSQEQILQNCPFSGQSEILSGGVQSSSDDDSELLLTGIMMVSVSESSQEDYQTPPEHHSRSQNSSNDGHVPAPVHLQVKSDGVPDLEMNDSEPHGQKNIVDLTNDSDHDDPEETYLVEDDDSLMVDKNDTELIETGDSAENVVTQAFETELISSSPPVETADKVFEQMPKRGDVATTTATKANATTGKRKLPFTIDSKHQTRQDNKGNEAFTGIMDRVLSLLGGMPKHDNNDDDDIDLIETAKMRGMTFPRPRWWPPEGFKE